MRATNASAAKTAQPVVMKGRRGLIFVPDWDEDPDNGTLLPTKMEVCPRCDGRGKHDHPAFSNGITASEWNSDDWDDDSREAYMRGHYDVRCEECSGNNVVSIPDEDRMTPVQIEALHQYYRDERSYRAEIEMERRMGC